MGKTSYQNISALVKELEAQLEKLGKGNLSLEEIENLVNSSKEIYERLVVVRYKAYESFGEPAAKKVKAESPVIEKPAIAKAVEAPVEEKKPEPPVVEPVAESSPFDFTPFEDDSAKKISEPKIVRPTTVAKDFDFSEDAFEQPAAEEETPAPVVAKEVKKPIDKVRAEIKSESAPLHEKFMKDEEEPLNEKLKQDSSIPLRKKIAKTVTDLRSEIGIGKKFEYINFLFGGDAKAYEAGIDALNAAPDSDSAKAKLAEFTDTYNWNLEEKTITKFIELVQRRFK